MSSVDSQEQIDIFLPGIQLDQLEDYCFMIDMVGINSHNILIAKPKAGNEAAVKDAFDSYFANLQANGGFYPAGAESVAGAVNSVTDDGYYYIVSHQMGKEIADVMAAAK